MNKFLTLGVVLLLQLNVWPLFSQTVDVFDQNYLMDGTNPNFVWARQISDNKLAISLTDDYLEVDSDRFILHSQKASFVLAYYSVDHLTNDIIFYTQNIDQINDTLGRYQPDRQVIYAKNDMKLLAYFNQNNEMRDAQHKLIMKSGQVNKIQAAFFGLYYILSKKEIE